MIAANGRRWGTAAEIATALGPDITPAMVRRWADRDGLTRVRLTDADGRPQVRYRYDQAAAIEASKRHSTRGRPRQVDVGTLTAA